MCDDDSPEDRPEEDASRAEPEGDEQPWDDDQLAEFARELFGGGPLDGEPEGREEEQDAAADRGPAPGERVLFALAQLYRLHRIGRLPVHPSAFDIEDLARLVGVGDEYEFSTEDRLGQHFHFRGEVLSSDPEQSFPWRLRTIWEWAAEQEMNSYWAEGWE